MKDLAEEWLPLCRKALGGRTKTEAEVGGWRGKCGLIKGNIMGRWEQIRNRHGSPPAGSVLHSRLSRMEEILVEKTWTGLQGFWVSRQCLILEKAPRSSRGSKWVRKAAWAALIISSPSPGLLLQNRRFNWRRWESHLGAVPAGRLGCYGDRSGWQEHFEPVWGGEPQGVKKLAVAALVTRAAGTLALGLILIQRPELHRPLHGTQERERWAGQHQF